jgi:hypothetical protein
VESQPNVRKLFLLDGVGRWFYQEGEANRLPLLRQGGRVGRRAARALLLALVLDSTEAPALWRDAPRPALPPQSDLSAAFGEELKTLMGSRGAGRNALPKGYVRGGERMSARHTVLRVAAGSDVADVVAAAHASILDVEALGGLVDLLAEVRAELNDAYASLRERLERPGRRPGGIKGLEGVVGVLSAWQRAAMRALSETERARRVERTHSLDIVRQWVLDPRTAGIFVVHGPANSGKTELLKALEESGVVERYDASEPTESRELKRALANLGIDAAGEADDGRNVGGEHTHMPAIAVDHLDSTHAESGVLVESVKRSTSLRGKLVIAIELSVDELPWWAEQLPRLDLGAKEVEYELRQIVAAELQHLASRADAEARDSAVQAGSVSPQEIVELSDCDLEIAKQICRDVHDGMPLRESLAAMRPETLDAAAREDTSARLFAVLGAVGGRSIGTDELAVVLSLQEADVWALLDQPRDDVRPRLRAGRVTADAVSRAVLRAHGWADRGDQLIANAFVRRYSDWHTPVAEHSYLAEYGAGHVDRARDAQSAHDLVRALLSPQVLSYRWGRAPAPLVADLFAIAEMLPHTTPGARLLARVATRLRDALRSRTPNSLGGVATALYNAGRNAGASSRELGLYLDLEQALAETETRGAIVRLVERDPDHPPELAWWFHDPNTPSPTSVVPIGDRYLVLLEAGRALAFDRALGTRKSIPFQNEDQELEYVTAIVGLDDASVALGTRAGTVAYWEIPWSGDEPTWCISVADVLSDSTSPSIKALARVSSDTVAALVTRSVSGGSLPSLLAIASRAPDAGLPCAVVRLDAGDYRTLRVVGNSALSFGRRDAVFVPDLYKDAGAVSGARAFESFLHDLPRDIELRDATIDPSTRGVVLALSGDTPMRFYRNPPDDGGPLPTGDMRGGAVAVCCLGDGRVAAALDSGRIAICDLRDGTVCWDVQAPAPPASELVLAEGQGGRLVVGTNGDLLVAVNVDDARLYGPRHLPHRSARIVALRGQYALTWGGGGLDLRVWDCDALLDLDAVDHRLVRRLDAVGGDFVAILDDHVVFLEPAPDGAGYLYREATDSGVRGAENLLGSASFGDKGLLALATTAGRLLLMSSTRRSAADVTARLGVYVPHGLVASSASVLYAVHRGQDEQAGDFFVVRAELESDSATKIVRLDPGSSPRALAASRESVAVAIDATHDQAAAVVVSRTGGPPQVAVRIPSDVDIRALSYVGRWLVAGGVDGSLQYARLDDIGSGRSRFGPLPGRHASRVSSILDLGHDFLLSASADGIMLNRFDERGKPMLLGDVTEHGGAVAAVKQELDSQREVVSWRLLAGGETQRLTHLLLTAALSTPRRISMRVLS